MDLSSLRKLLIEVNYLRIPSSVESLLHSGEERFQLLQWLFEKFIGETNTLHNETILQPKSPSPSANVSKDEVRINHLANLAVLCGATENYEIELIRGSGSASERINFLFHLLELFKSSQEYDRITIHENEDGHSLLLDSAIKEVSNLNLNFSLFPNDVKLEQINNQFYEDEMKNILFDFKNLFFEYQSLLGEVGVKQSIISDNELTLYKEKICKIVNEFYGIANKFDKVYSIDSHHLDFQFDRPELIGIGPLSTSILKFHNMLHKFLDNVKRFKRCQEIGSAFDENQVFEMSKDNERLLEELQSSLKSMNVLV